MTSKNFNRAIRVRRAIRTEYKNHSHMMVPEDIIDTLADIRHLCDIKRLDFADLDRIAYQHYLEELDRPEPITINATRGNGPLV